MITCRTAKQCGQADYGWLQARYTFSFGHYFDPDLMGYASLRVLNQEVLEANASFKPRTYPNVDVLNILLQGQAEYRDSEGHSWKAGVDDCILISSQPKVSYSEQNIDASGPLTRLQLWLDACPNQTNPLFQRLSLSHQAYTLIASPTGEQGSLQLRQQVWIHHIQLQAGEQYQVSLRGSRAYMQSIYGSLILENMNAESCQKLGCGDGAFINDEKQIIFKAVKPVRLLLLDLPV